MKNLREILLVLLVLETPCTSCSAQPSRFQPAPPLTKPASVSEEAWLKDWANKLVANTSLKASENQIYPNSYPVYSVRLSLENKTGHRLITGRNLYLIQTAKQSREDEPTTDLLRVIDGYFKQPPLENYAGAVEIRGERLIDRERMGLIDWVTTENRGGFYSALATILHIGGFRSRHPGAQNFGEALPGGRLVIDTEDLQLSIAVKPEKLADARDNPRN